MPRAAIRTRSSFVLVPAVICLFFSSLSSPARASLFYGQTLSYQVQTNGIGDTVPADFVVNDTSITDTPEITLGGTVGIGGVVPGTVTVTDNIVYIKYAQNANFYSSTFNGYVLSDVSQGIPPITSATVDSNTTVAGFNASLVTFDAKDLYINVSGLSAQVGGVIQIDLNQSSAIPEPSPLALIAVFGLGSAAVVWVRRRRVGNSSASTLSIA